jgi:hypothetical protein
VDKEVPGAAVEAYADERGFRRDGLGELRELIRRR